MLLHSLQGYSILEAYLDASRCYSNIQTTQTIFDINLRLLLPPINHNALVEPEAVSFLDESAVRRLWQNAAIKVAGAPT